MIGTRMCRLAAAAATALSPSVAVAGALGLPPDASSEGWRIDRLFAWTHGLVGFVALIAFGGLAVALLRFRSPKTPHYTHGTRPRAVAVPLAAAAFVLLVIDGNLFWTASRDLRTLGDVQAAAEKPDAVRIQLTARQWSWEARYPGPDGDFGTDQDVVVTDHVRVPIGRPVVVQLASIDVVHALNLPNFRVKLQAIPGRINSLWFQGEELGRFEIACAQHCGPMHYKMRGVLEVVTGETFGAWIARESADAVRMRRERARAEDEEVAEGLPWPAWEETPETGAWSWEEGMGEPGHDHEQGHEPGDADE